MYNYNKNSFKLMCIYIYKKKDSVDNHVFHFELARKLHLESSEVSEFLDKALSDGILEASIPTRRYYQFTLTEKGKAFIEENFSEEVKVYNFNVTEEFFRNRENVSLSDFKELEKSLKQKKSLSRVFIGIIIGFLGFIGTIITITLGWKEFFKKISYIWGIISNLINVYKI